MKGSKSFGGYYKVFNAGETISIVDLVLVTLYNNSMKGSKCLLAVVRDVFKRGKEVYSGFGLRDIL